MADATPTTAAPATPESSASSASSSSSPPDEPIEQAESDTKDAIPTSDLASTDTVGNADTIIEPEVQEDHGSPEAAGVNDLPQDPLVSDDAQRVNQMLSPMEDSTAQIINATTNTPSSPKPIAVTPADIPLVMIAPPPSPVTPEVPMPILQDATPVISASSAAQDQPVAVVRVEHATEILTPADKSPSGPPVTEEQASDATVVDSTAATASVPVVETPAAIEQTTSAMVPAVVIPATTGPVSIVDVPAALEPGLAPILTNDRQITPIVSSANLTTTETPTETSQSLQPAVDSSITQPSVDQSSPAPQVDVVKDSGQWQRTFTTPQGTTVTVLGPVVPLTEDIQTLPTGAVLPITAPNEHLTGAPAVPEKTVLLQEIPPAPLQKGNSAPIEIPFDPPKTDSGLSEQLIVAENPAAMQKPVIIGQPLPVDPPVTAREEPLHELLVARNGDTATENSAVTSIEKPELRSNLVPSCPAACPDTKLSLGTVVSENPPAIPPSSLQPLHPSKHHRRHAAEKRNHHRKPRFAEKDKLVHASSTDHQPALQTKPSLLKLRTQLKGLRNAQEQLNKQNVVPIVMASLPSPVGLDRRYVQQSATDLIVQQHIYSHSGNDFTVTTANKQSVMEIRGRSLSTSARMRFLEKDNHHLVCEMRKKPFRLMSSWYITVGKVKKLTMKSQLSLGTRSIHVRLINIFDGKPVDLFLQGHFAQDKCAVLHLGRDNSGPVVAHVQRDVMNSRQILHRKQTYQLQVVAQFDVLVATAVCVAFEDRPSDRLGRTAIRKK